MRYFFYGTLLDAEVRRRVLAPHDTGIALAPAALPGWRRVHMRGRTYPVVVPARGERVDGLLATGLSAAAARRLAAFETDEYRERSAPVITADGETVIARVFVARLRTFASERPWSEDAWHRRHRAAFIRGLHSRCA